MCDARVSMQAKVIAYASGIMDPAQLNYMTTEKELLEIVFALDKFRSYLIEIRKGAENSMADHLSRIERETDPMPTQDDFLNEKLLQMIPIGQPKKY
ncbi:hypothetical protein CR513_36584, partial [Mucuna pruriens]